MQELEATNSFLIGQLKRVMQQVLGPCLLSTADRGTGGTGVYNIFYVLGGS